MSFSLQAALIIGGVAIVLIAGALVLIARFYRKVDQGHALIINKMKTEPEVTFTGGVVFPIIHRAEVMDISVKTIEIDRRGKEGLICKDNIRGDIKVTFFVRVNKTKEDVLKVAQSIGCTRASDQQTIEELFTAKFSEALKSVGKGLDFEELYTEREGFRDEIIKMIGHDLNGYALEDAAIDYLEQTPMDLLDPENILDADGIRTITSRTTTQNIKTNELRQHERMEIGKQNLVSDEAIYRYDQARADAEAKKAKEISMAQARESNAAARLKVKESLATKLEQEKAQQEAEIAEQTRARAVAVAEQARLRDIGVEEVNVKKAREVTDIGRIREVQLAEIDKDQEVEVKKKKIADVIRERIAVEKTVAEEEESIKDLRANAGAKREKDVIIIGAEGEAQQGLVKEIKKAEASEECAKFKARERLTLAEAALEASDREARAKIRMAEGVQAEEAATGLAKVRVEEAQAVAIEKQGFAKAKVRDQDVSVREREGLVEAQVTKEKLLAEAAGAQQKGLAGVHVKEADAGATEKMGHAEATAVRERLLAEAAGQEAEAVAIEKKLVAEASGLRQKAEAMQALDGVGREHEEFRISLDARKEIELQGLRARVDMAEAQARILSKAFDQANINIVGGDGDFFDRFVQAVTVGQSIDGAVDQSAALQGVFRDHLSGDRNLIEDLKGVLSTTALSPDSLKSLTISGLLGKLMVGKDGEVQDKLQSLADQAKELGIDELIPKEK